MTEVNTNMGSARKLKILVCALADLSRCPRPLRMVNMLKASHHVTYMGYSADVSDVELISVQRTRSLIRKVIRLLTKIFRIHLVTQHTTFSIAQKDLPDHGFDVILCHDIQLMPLLSRMNLDAKLVLDLREFYPKQFDHLGYWKLLESPFYHYLCTTYLKQADLCLTVSSGLQQAYKESYGVTPTVVHSFAPASDIPITFNETGPLKLIYHGAAVDARAVHVLIEAMDLITVDATLDLMLVGEGKYRDKLNAMAQKSNKVTVVPPVQYSEIVAKTNKYDAGIIFYPPSTFNIDNCMPNKLFEMIQARVPIITSPISSLKIFIIENQLGWVCDGFTAESLAHQIETLSKQMINDTKQHIDTLAAEMSQEHDNIQLSRLLLEK